jgi:hypothetical protein
VSATQVPSSSFVAPETVVVTINGAERKLYAMSVKTFLELEAIVKPALTSLTVLLDPPKQSVREKVSSGDNARLSYSDVSVEVLKHWGQTRDKATAELTSALLAPRNAELLRKVIADALREEWPRPVKITAEQAKAFDEMDLPTAARFVKGIVEVNKKAFEEVFPLGLGVATRGILEAATPTVTTDSSSRS